MLRNITCGELSINDVNKEVVLCGWVDTIRDLGALVFIDLRDKYGITQLNVEPSLFKKADLHLEYCIQAKGIVIKKEVENKNLKTGAIEVKVSEIKVFSKSAPTPFAIKDECNTSEDTRLVYRYLDLRRPVMQKNLYIRSLISRYAREFLVANGFMEIDTPTLIRSTPEGARDYLVPSRIQKGKFYALPQSPQLYKQLLMIASCDRYFQLAHCYRDEDQRADRQPEFMQIDCEMSFVEREDVLNIIEGLLKYIFKNAIGVTLPDFKRITYADAISFYGSDKPDMRYEMLIHDVTDILADSGFKAYEGKKVEAIVINGSSKLISRKKMEEDNLLAKKFRVFGVSHLKMENNALTGSIVKNIDSDKLSLLIEKLSLKDGDVVIICADSNKDKACIALGALRTHYAEVLNLTKKDDYKPLFVIDWPLFEREDDGTIVSLSNPFTRPIDEDLHYLDTDPTKIRSTSYDTVLNGVELSSGALRIHDGEVQKKVFELLGLSDEDIKERFGFLVEALKYGTPPEGGFGIGVERLAMELAKTDNVRDVVAFPKNLKAVEPMSMCPSEVPKEDTDILGLEIKHDEE